MRDEALKDVNFDAFFAFDVAEEVDQPSLSNDNVGVGGGGELHRHGEKVLPDTVRFSFEHGGAFECHERFLYMLLRI